MNHNQSNLFLLVKEGANIIAYPVVVLFPQDETGVRYITFLPLREMRDKYPTALSVVHRQNLHQFGDMIEIKDAEMSFEDENSLLASLCNMLVGPRYQYVQGSDTEYEKQYKCFIESICNVVQQLLKNKPSQKELLNTIYSLIQRGLNAFHSSQTEVIEFMAILDEVINAMVDDNGIITSDSVEVARQYLNDDTDTSSEPTVVDEKDLGWTDTDAQFFANLL